MLLNAESCYQALVSRDRRFDGVYYVGVRTTRVYCRFVCPAKNPRPENCTFFPSAAAAEQAGYRPCLRCRPELAPGNARIDSVSRLAAIAASRIEDGALNEAGVQCLAAAMGISERHLRRVVESEFGVSPIELAQTHRLLLAKRLLTDTDLPVIEVAFASGFSSVRRFNSLFKERYRLNPTSLRKSRGGRVPQQALTCKLAYRPPLDWPSLLSFLAARCISGVEMVEEDRYLRTAAIGKHKGWIAVERVQDQAMLVVEVSASLAPVLPSVLAGVKRLFDLVAEPRRIAEDLGSLAKEHPGLRVPGAFDGFEVAVRTIVGQQVSVEAANRLAANLASRFGETLETSHEGLVVLTPTPQRMAGLQVQDIIEVGVTRSRAEAIVALARGVVESRVKLAPGVDADETIAQLKKMPGIGEWTAQYVAMRALSWPDAFPLGDLGIMRALGQESPKLSSHKAEQWRPWRAYAAMHLWKSLESNNCTLPIQPAEQGPIA